MKRLLHFNACTLKLCEKFVHKYSETTEYVKNESTFSEIYKLRGQITR